METRLVRIEKPKGINSLIGSDGKAIDAEMYVQDQPDRNSTGKFVSRYDGSFPTSRKHFAPLYDTLKREYPWNSTNEEFKRLVDALQLKYPKGHPKYGEFIVATDVKRHQKNFDDPIFTNQALLSRLSMRGGVGTFNLGIPEEAFMYYTLSGRRDVSDDSTDEGPANPLRKSGMSLMFTSTEKQNIRKRATTDNILEAMGAINDAKHDVKRLRAYAVLFNIPGLSILSDANEIVNTMTQYVSDYGTKPQKNSSFGTLNQTLVAHSKMNDEELRTRFSIKLARDKGVIKTSKEGFYLRDSYVAGPSNLDQIYSYFNSSSEEATEHLVVMLERLKELNALDS